MLLGIGQTDIKVPEVVNHEHDDQIFSVTMNTSEHPNVKITTAQAQIANYKRLQALRSWLPKVDLFAHRTLYTFRDREFDDQANRLETVFGIQLSMELFNGGNSYSESTSFAAEALGLERESTQTKLEILSQFEATKSELKLTHQLVLDSKKTLEKNARYFSRSIDEYRRGVKNSIDLLNVSQRNLSVKRRYVELRRDYQLAKTELLSMIGQ